ncbi:hypothetical protein KW404_21645, partial [Xanthomonas vasicola pv. vasculorum]|nr:hypothetical protein [Xanthomonas vasicola pv. vasculorum]
HRWSPWWLVCRRPLTMDGSILRGVDSLGILIGSIVVFILAGKLERIAGLFGLAADRIEQRPAPEKEIV